MQRLTSGVSYVCTSSLKLPHLVMRPLSSQSELSEKARGFCEVLKQEVFPHLSSLTPPRVQMLIGPLHCISLPLARVIYRSSRSRGPTKPHQKASNTIHTVSGLHDRAQDANPGSKHWVLLRSMA